MHWCLNVSTESIMQWYKSLYDVYAYNWLYITSCILFRLSAIQKNDLYDLMVTDRTIAQQQSHGDKSFLFPGEARAFLELVWYLIRPPPPVLGCTQSLLSRFYSGWDVTTVLHAWTVTKHTLHSFISTGWRKINRTIQTVNRVYENLRKICLLYTSPSPRD